MKSKHLIIALTATAAAVLAACGGGGATTTSGSAQVQSVTVQTYITDNLATEYSKVWVSIKKISVIDGSGAEVNLFDATAAPAVVNLSSLASVGQFMSTVAIPAGIYSEIHVTLANTVQLVSLDGATTTDAKFDASGTDFVWKVRNVSIDASSGGQIVLDFNLAKFSYNATTGLVTPALDLPKPVDAFRKFVHQKAELHGTVQKVDAQAGTITMDDPRLGNGVVVTLAKDAVLLNEADGKILTLADITAGTRVEIRGTVTPGATTADPVTVLATVVHVEPAAAPTAPRVRGEGVVTAVAGTLVTVTVNEANFLPGTNSVVVDVSAAKFAHGSAADIATGVKLEFGGTVSGTGNDATVKALMVDIEGAPSADERTKNPGAKFTGVNGAIGMLNSDGTVNVTVTRGDGPWVVPGTYVVNPANAVYIQGNATCLIVGNTVKAVGTLAGTTLTAKYIVIPGCGGQKRSEPPAPPSPGASAPAPAASAPEPTASAPH
jgi:hypothetical protein